VFSMMRRRSVFLGAILAGIAIAGLAPAARAGFELEYSVNHGVFHVVVGSGSGTLADPYFANAFIGHLTISATGSGTTTPGISSLDLSVGGVEAANTNIRIFVSMTDVVTAPPPESLTTTFGNAQDTNATVTMADYLAASNHFFDLSDPVVGPMTVPASVTINGSAKVSLTPNYSWTLGTTLDTTHHGQSNTLSTDNNGQLTTTPAPAGLVLLASAAPMLVGGTWWRRRSRKAHAVS
jgi:hypothetical protein